MTKALDTLPRRSLFKSEPVKADQARANMPLMMPKNEAVDKSAVYLAAIIDNTVALFHSYKGGKPC